MSDYRKKFLSLWSAIMEEERWHKFESQACKPSCKGWNAWAPLCECGENYCTFKPSGNLEDMQMVIVSKPLNFQYNCKKKILAIIFQVWINHT